MTIEEKITKVLAEHGPLSARGVVGKIKGSDLQSIRNRLSAMFREKKLTKKLTDGGLPLVYGLKKK